MTHAIQRESGNSDAQSIAQPLERNQREQIQLAYWKQQLAGSLAMLELPTDCPRAIVQTFQSARQLLELPTTLTEAIEALSQQEKTTSFVTLLAAFKVLLYRYTGQENIIICSPIAHRNSVASYGFEKSYIRVPNYLYSLSCKKAITDGWLLMAC